MVDYSRWKHIEISDDEDETHPNIDTPSLYRWRHQARIERMDEMKKEREDFNKKKKLHEKKMKEIKDKVKAGSLDEIQQLQALEIESKKLSEEEEELNRREKKAPWNVDTISKPGFQKTIINKNPTKKSDDNLSEEEKDNELRTFVKNNESLIKQYGMLRKYEDSKKFLLDHLHLVNEHTANHLVMLCIKYEMDNKHDLMKHMAHQCICMQYILELGKQLNVDPRAYIASFFLKMENTNQYRQHVEMEITAFIERIEKRAQEKIEEAAAEQEEEDRLARLGPGGLDPVDVFNELPEELQNCFETRDIKLLQDTIEKMPADKARYYMQRCIDSGLWVPNARDQENEGGELSETGKIAGDGKITETGGLTDTGNSKSETSKNDDYSEIKKDNDNKNESNLAAAADLD